MDLETGDIVLCTVNKIIGTTVFVTIEYNGEGSIIFSEIAPGRIRNIRDYVIPKKKIVCKVLRIRGNNIDLSLRRVTKKEQKEVKDQYKQEKSYQSILKSILGEKTQEIIKKIKAKERLYDFLEKAKEKPAELEKIVGKEDTEKILNILKSQKQKKATLKKEIHLKSDKSNGLELIKKTLGNIKNADVNYISAGKYTLSTEADNIKSADNLLKQIISEIETKAKKQGMEFSIK